MLRGGFLLLFLGREIVAVVPTVFYAGFSPPFVMQFRRQRGLTFAIDNAHPRSGGT